MGTEIFPRERLENYSTEAKRQRLVVSGRENWEERGEVNAHSKDEKEEGMSHS